MLLEVAGRFAWVVLEGWRHNFSLVLRGRRGFWVVALAELFEGLFEDDAGVVVVEIGEPVVTAEVDGVVVALLLIAFQMARHESYGTSGLIRPLWGVGRRR